jgi:hypothetical protein
MKRILVLLSVVALMVVMLALSVGPAFARNIYQCTDPITRDQQFVLSNADKKDLEAAGWVCTKVPKKPTPG